MKFITIRANGTEDKLIVFAFGGSEQFFVEKGFSVNLGHIAGILLGPNSSLLMDTTFGHGAYAVEKAGLTADYLSAAWEYILKRFDFLPERSVLELELSADDEYGWKVTDVVEDKGR